MPSLLASAALAALAGAGTDSRRRLVEDLSMTPCTHTICGARRLATDPGYTVGSKVPQTGHNGGFGADGATLISLDTAVYSVRGGGVASGKIVRDGNNIKVSVTLDSDYLASETCVLGVNVVHNKGGSDKTLQKNLNEYVADDTKDGEYSGASTLSAPADVPIDPTTRTAEVLVDPSYYPYRYEGNDGKKLHTGRLGITVEPYLDCTGFDANGAGKMLLKEKNEGETPLANPGLTHYPFYYDLVAHGTTLASKDEAGTPSGALSPGGDAKRKYVYNAAFQHFHDQVRFPDPNENQPSVMAGRSAGDHFSGLSDPKDATCQWNNGAYVSGINQAALQSNGWMSGDDDAVQTQAYGDWTPGDCTNGICKKYHKDATVDTTDAYLPFDKPLVKYYSTLPKIECQSQGTDPVGDVATTELVPEIANDAAPSIVSGVKTSFHTVQNIDCSPKEGKNSDICKTGSDQLTILGQIFSFQVTTSHFVDLLADEFDFSATYECASDRTDGADPCSINNGAQTAAQKIASLSRGNDATDNLVAQLDAKAVAVQDITFRVPTLYGTTFSGFKATISGNAQVQSSHNYRATGNFAVTMLASGDKIQWNGGDVNTAKEFEGSETTTRFDARTPAVLTSIRVKPVALATDGTGYFTVNATFDDDIMSPFRNVGDLADSADATERDAAALLAGEMSPANQFYAVKSFCCGKDDAVTVGGVSINCQASRKDGLAAADAGASTYCRTNGFEAVRCLSSVLDVEYTVTTSSSDDRYLEDTKTAVKTYTNNAIASLSQADQGFVVANAAYDAVTVGAGGQAGTASHDYSVATTHMGTATATFARTTTGEDKTYNCESAGRTIDYSVSVATPCGESDAGTTGAYSLNATVEAHYVYTKGTEGTGTVDQVSQTTTTGSLGTKDTGAVAYESNAHWDWETTEWRVQDSSDPASDAKGSGTPIRLKVVIANDAGADTGLHLPASKVHIRNPTLKAGDGSVALEDCYDDGAERYCVLLYTNDNIMSISANKYCGTTQGGITEPTCPEIEYTIAAKVKNGGDSLGIDAFGQNAACGATPATEWTQIGDPRTHTLKVLGNNRAYDGVIDIRVAERDDNCDIMCTNEGYDPSTYAFNGGITTCADPSFTDGTNADFQKPTRNGAETYCLNGRPMAEETLHDVAVPGKDGAATTILDQGTDLAKGKILSSKDLTFKVKYFRIGQGPRKFTFTGLDLPAELSHLPQPFICSTTNYEGAEGCVRDGADTKSATIQTSADNDDSYFYLSLGTDKDIDVCAQTNVGNDPYTTGAGELSLGFSIKVEYVTSNDGNGDAATGSGDPDSGVEHKFYFKLQCPQKDYSLNLVQATPPALGRVDKSIQVNQDIGLVDKNSYADSHVNFITMHTYFAGRSTERYKTVGASKSLCLAGDLADPATVCHKAAIRLEQPAGIDNVRFKGGAAEVFLDDADTFETRQELELEFTNPCLFTTLTLVSKSTPILSGVFDTSTDTDVRFTFRVQCPRWQQTESSDSLKLEYNVDSTDFGVTGGFVRVEQPALSQDGMVNDFASITTSLKGALCDDNPASGTCIFPDVGAGNLSTLSKQGAGESQQSWLDYLTEQCGFQQDNNDNGNFVGFMERQYTRANLAGGGTQDYCSGRKLSFGVVKSGSHTASIRVSSPVEMEFAVQIQNLEWKQDLCDASNNEWYMQAEASLYRKTVGGAWIAASASTFTEFTFVRNFFGAPAKTIVGEKLTIQGGCQKLETDGSGVETNCAAFEAEREVDFGALYSLYGVDYRAQLGVDFSMSCPRGQLDGSTSGGIALRHSSDCSNYGEAGLSSCNVANGVAEVAADGQIQLTLIIDDTAFLSHTVSKPTYVQKEGAATIGSGNVEDLCSADQVDCVYRANDGTADIPLVGFRAYPDTPVTIDGTSYDWKDRADEENSVVTLRALPLSGTTVEITWVVDRVFQDASTRRLRATYTLGANDPTGADSLSFRVIPATREEEAGIAASEAESVAEDAETTQRTFATTPSGEEEEDGSVLMTVVWVGIGVVGALVIGFAVVAKTRKSGSGGSGDKAKQSRFYQYSRLEKQEHARTSRFL